MIHYSFLLSMLAGVVCLFDMILYAPVNYFQLCRDGSARVEPVLSKDFN